MEEDLTDIVVSQREEGTGFQDAGIEPVEVPTSPDVSSVEESIALEGGEPYRPTIGHMESYFNTITPGAIAINNPDTQFVLITLGWTDNRGKS